MTCTNDCAQGRACKCEALLQASATAAREAGCWCPPDDPATGFDKWAGALGSALGSAVGAACAIAMGLALGYSIAKDWGVL